MGHSIETHQWLAYIVRAIKKVTHDGNRREVHLAKLPSLKVGRNCEEANEIFEFISCFDMYVHVRPNDTNPLAK